MKRTAAPGRSRQSAAQQIGQLPSRLAQWRQERGVSADAVARAIGVHRNTIVDLESGKRRNPSLQVLLGLQAYFDLRSIEELFGPVPAPEDLPSRRLAEARRVALTTSPGRRRKSVQDSG